MYVAFFSYLCKNHVLECEKPDEGEGMNRLEMCV